MESLCDSCGKTVLFIKEAVYEGFKKTGEVMKCTACGHSVPVEEESSVEKNPQAAVIPSIFSESDRSPTISIPGQDEAVEMCGHCKHYIVNPFTQRCGIHERAVSATDSCDDFEASGEAPAD